MSSCVPPGENVIVCKDIRLSHLPQQLRGQVRRPEGCGTPAPLISCACEMKRLLRRGESKKLLACSAIEGYQGQPIPKNSTYHLLRVLVQKVEVLEIFGDIFCSIFS